MLSFFLVIPLKNPIEAFSLNNILINSKNKNKTNSNVDLLLHLCKVLLIDIKFCPNKITKNYIHVLRYNIKFCPNEKSLL